MLSVFLYKVDDRNPEEILSTIGKGIAVYSAHSPIERMHPALDLISKPVWSVKRLVHLALPFKLQAVQTH
jgi:hypothetical protein